MSRRASPSGRPRATTPRSSKRTSNGCATWKASIRPAELIVAKQRHGATGKVRIKFDSRVTKFSDAADENYLPEMRG